LRVRNIGRNKLRTSLTVLGVMVTILAFVLLRTVIWVVDGASRGVRVGPRRNAAQDQLHHDLAKRYAEEDQASARA